MDVFGPLSVLMSFAMLSGIVLVMYFFVKLRWKKAGPDEALIIYGRKKFFGRKRAATESVDLEAQVAAKDEVDLGGVQIIRGGGKFVWPGWEQYERLSLKLMNLEIDLSGVYSKDNIPLTVCAIAQVKIRGDARHIIRAAECFLGMDEKEIQANILETVSGHLRGIIGQLTAVNLYQQQDEFQQQVKKQAEGDLAGMGCEFKAFVFKKIDDDQGYYESLGEPEVQDAKRKAREATAEADEKATIREENARLAKENRALEVNREVLDEKEQFELREQEVAEKVNRATAKAQKAKELEETERDIMIAEKAVQRERERLQADVREKADADAYALEKQAAARRKEREEQAEADKAEGLARARVIEAEGEAEASAIKAKGLAEAEGRQKIAEALSAYDSNALKYEVIGRLPEVMAAMAEPLSRAGETTIISTGNSTGTGAAKLTGDLLETLGTVAPSIKQLTGVDIFEVLEGLAQLPGAAAESLRGKSKADSDEEPPSAS